MPRLAYVGFIASLLGYLSVSCLCGHIAAVGLLGTAPGAALAWIDFVTAAEKRLLTRGVWFAVLFTSCVLLKNIHNVLWSGHTPLLG